MNPSQKTPKAIFEIRFIDLAVGGLSSAVSWDG
jgi:hypothetical protein